MNEKQKYKNSPLEKRKRRRRKKNGSVTRETNGNRGNQMMLGQCHLATSEPMKSLAVEGGVAYVNEQLQNDHLPPKLPQVQ